MIKFKTDTRTFKNLKETYMSTVSWSTPLIVYLPFLQFRNKQTTMNRMTKDYIVEQLIMMTLGLVKFKSV